MKTLAEFKRNLTVGRKLHTTFHLFFAGRDEQGNPIYKDQDKGEREISIVQTNSFALKTLKKEPVYGRDEYGNRIETGEFVEKIVDSWCQYPKLKETVFNDNGSITILEEQRTGKLIPVLTYTII